MKNLFYKFFFIVCFLSSWTVTAYAQSWMDESWQYRREVTINNPGSNELTDFQIKIELDNTNFDFTHALNDGGDLRITTNDGTTTVSFWIESWNAEDELATIWANIPNIPLSISSLWLYYGNVSATNVSNGRNTFRFFDDFESWNSSSGQTGWSDITSTPNPPKADNTAAVYNGKLYVFGGYGINSNTYLNEVFVYDPGFNTWETRTPMPTARWGMVAVEFNGLIYVFAGQGTSNNKNEVYDPLSNTWDVSKNPVPANIAQQGLMGVKYGNKIHLFYKSYHYEYDPETDIYTQLANVPRQVTWSTCATVGNKIYIIGGYSYDSPTDACNDNYEYDPATNTWTTKTPMPVSRYGATRENPVINGKIYVTHGHAGTPFFVTNYAYDPATDTWEQKGPALHPRDGVSCGVIDNHLYVIGGRDVPSNPYGVAWSEVYYPEADTWIAAGNDFWETSGITYVNATAAASYQGNFGLTISQTSNVNTNRYAGSVESFGAVYALDFDWNVTTIGGVGGIGSTTRPETEVRVTEDPNWYGNLYFYNDASAQAQTLRWYNGTQLGFLQNGTRDVWHKVSLIRNGVNSGVIFDGNEYHFSIPTSGTGKFRFNIIFETTMYVDNVRVRKYTAPEPTITVADEDIPLPVELASFSASVNSKSVTLNWRTETEVNNYGFEVLRQSKPDKDWTMLGFVNGNGSSNTPKSYTFEDNNLTPGKYSYRLKQIDNDGQYEYSNSIDVNIGITDKFELRQNYPNPFNPTTSISFSLPAAGNVRLTLYNILGEEVKSIVNEFKESGTHTIKFDATELNSGIYIYKLEFGSFIESRKMIVIK